MQKILPIFVFIFCLAFFFGNVDAKVLPQAVGKSSFVPKKTVGTATSVSVFPRLRADRKALNVSFGGLTSANSVSYTLTYSQNGQQEGAGGSITPNSASATRELLFGTCSGSVCKYHSNIKNTRLEVVIKLKSGKVIKKKYKINV